MNSAGNWTVRLSTGDLAAAGGDDFVFTSCLDSVSRWSYLHVGGFLGTKRELRSTL
ncbi:tryptamine hydroxycinnamoyltransferase 2-like [Iris pallida]|uniref:Tryptamine hydroxycinnamoyltransferase 2-like n=1 Tax=Iris pallida TaxID=29817 RepID=A0AAX6EIE0_IRIPA|nr:tryptamine hydroxycinnamoyltransferase 2-like [Iris pallida]KAJ6803698.1 tryptamine hydroxycinnamoyltransferase 2-like [Iris pallida]